ncbi:MAG: hypothetical protein QXS02_05485, partial [Candidatus Thermoplasmatota archaeon]
FKLNIGAEKTFKVKIFVPSDTNLKSDQLTFTIISTTNENTKESVNVTVKVISGGLLEEIYNMFLSISSTIGLDNLFGDEAPVILMIIILSLIFLGIIIILLLIKKKQGIVHCPSLIKDIKPEEEAIYSITIKNPTRTTKDYNISVEYNDPSNKWNINLDKEHVEIPGKNADTVNLTVKPSYLTCNDDWIESKVKIKSENKLIKEFSTVTTLHHTDKPNLKIKNVINTPSEFKPKDRVVTSFIIQNNDPTAAKDIKAILYINNKEKNRVTNINIPGYGYAEISIPWIAERGKNDLRITLNK